MPENEKYTRATAQGRKAQLRTCFSHPFACLETSCSNACASDDSSATAGAQCFKNTFPAVATSRKATPPVRLFAVIVALIISSFAIMQPQKPVLYIIGDSTVKNGSGAGSDGLWGWGNFMAGYFDTTRISVENHAIGGRSSRTFITEGRWQRILDRLKPGDYVLMQFGHNDASPLDDTARARGTIRGTGNESREIYNPIRKIHEVVYTYGWYMRKYIDETKAKGAIPIVCSPVPRENFKNGKTIRSDSTYAGWAAQVAKTNGAFFIPLNALIADRYDAMGPEKVRAAYFPGDHTHTNRAGAELNAGMVIEGLKNLQHCSLRNHLK